MLLNVSLGALLPQFTPPPPPATSPDIDSLSCAKPNLGVALWGGWVGRGKGGQELRLDPPLTPQHHYGNLSPMCTHRAGGAGDPY